MKKTKEESRSRIHYRIRKKVAGSAERPRLSVFRSNKAIYAQLVDDTNGNVLTSASSALLETKSDNKVEQAKAVGKLIAEKAKDKNIDSVVFDRSGYLYHGRVKALAEGAREGGLNF
ncbi:MAG TPA: 50S ribosomal protein L18 [Saprospiraceae bacterium]|jgi:large subunit ribosomal protein L18|nr:MAG: 50S ribosomal protein L18 [Candidatus Parvibacillus calidus]MBX2937577.1 50S ribosomal protein L18 [Saprospiraceae bacterium]MBK7741882.1 50S ribosomal protein L18 [Candidatus Parvibacillus calidus]MBX7177932.1 50S ribosomal protein L18 [Saprospiraceae bacterium]MCB0589960.1 50S ribosomal protein L18 [Saprospiraceae bacterium]